MTVTEKITEALGNITKAKMAYLAVQATDPLKARELHELVKHWQTKLSSIIAEGAVPCSCGAGHPHGMIQPGTKGRDEYEVGCLVCTLRVRGGLLPKHAVEAWNELISNQKGA